MFETFRSRATIQAIYFDGSIETGTEIAKAFPSVISIEYTGGDTFLLCVRNQAAFVNPHTWVYKNDSGRLEWRDTEELGLKWEQTTSASPTKPKTGAKAPVRLKRAQ